MIAVCMAAGTTTLLDNSVLNIAIPVLRTSLHASATEVQWIVAGYSLSFGLTLVPGGRLGDVHGRKTFFLAGLATFTTVGVVAAVSTHPWTVIAARLLQGAAAGLVNSQVIGTIQDVFSGHDRARALGLYAVTSGVAAALGPPLGGALIAAAGPGLGWRLTLLLTVPFGLATLVLAVRYLPAPRPNAGHTDLDPVGTVLVGALALVVMVPFIQTPSHGAAVTGSAAAGCAVAGLIPVWQRRLIRAGGRPLLHPSLVGSAPFALGTAVAMAQFGASIAGSLVLTMFLQDGIGLPAAAAAVVTLPSAVAMGISSALAWRVVRRIGRHTVTLGLALSVCSVLASGLAALCAPAPALPVILGLTQFCAGTASGLTVSPNQALVLRHAPREAAGVAGGVLQMSQRIAAAVGVSAISGVYLHTAAVGTAHHRSAYWHTSLTCAGVLAVALAVSVLRGARTDTGVPDPSEPPHGAPPRAGKQGTPVPPEARP
ncbi:MFS transporter [Streptomyces antioxidans]|uniref:MFS transporter n=1 Tax=Streptomyces antioxidans TaxID=1507734 RepID=A0A1V4D895_9ACTN|nr:MFS transporter [Streptomyces antioxidans]